MMNCKSKSIPCDMSINSVCDDKSSTELTDLKEYKEIMGSLIYML